MWLRSVLTDAGVSGAREHFGMFTAGSFVSDFDQAAATPILLDALPSLIEPWMVGTVVRHLGSARRDPDRFAVLLTTYRRWLSKDQDLCDSIGAALIVAAAMPSDRQHVAEVLTLLDHQASRRAQRSIVEELWRLRHDERVVPVLFQLCRG